MSIADEALSKPAKAKKNADRPRQKGLKKFLPCKGDSRSEIISKIIVLVSIAALIICLFVLAKYFFEVYEAQQTHDDLLYIYNTNKVVPSIDDPLPGETTTSADLSSDTDEDISEEEEEIVLEPLELLPSAEAFLAINPDTAGYVRIPGVLEEVVVQGTDNSYYLTHNFYGSKRQCGTCFADYRAVVNDYLFRQSDNIILYAHNQKDGTMFGNMDYYRWNTEYWLQNPFIYFNNDYEEGTYVIFASFVTNTEPEDDNGNVFDYWNYVNFNDDYPYDYFMSEVTKRSTIITGVDVQPTDKFLTLSTCSTEFDNSRHALIARRLRDGETEADIDTTEFQVNPNPKWPAIYYKYAGGTYIETDEDIES
jgi:SrtB family sortase